MKRTLLLLVLVAGVLGTLLFPVKMALAANVLSPACNEGLVDPQTGQPPAACVGNSDQLPGGNDIYGPDGLLTRAAGLIARLVGITAVIMIIIGGFKYVTSAGDSSNVKSAKDTILFAIVGIVVAVAAQSIVVFVLSKL